MSTIDPHVVEVLQERFAQLPEVVRRSITSADVQAHLRKMAEHHKLHIDQWQVLENQVMLTLLGFHPIEELAQTIEREVEVPAEAAKALAADVSHVVFEPIRAELARELGAPTQETSLTSPPRPVGFVDPNEPPAPSAAKPVAVAKRVPTSSSYKTGQTSVSRPTPEGDPYRESSS